MPRRKNIFKGQGPAAALATLNNLPTTRVDVPYESPKDRIARQIREEENARVAPIIAQGNALRAEAETKIKQFWSQPLASLASAIDPNQKTASWATAITGPQDSSTDGRVDCNLGTFATTDAPFTDETLNAAFGTLEVFKTTVTARTGVVLSEQGYWRLFAFLGIQSEHQDLDATNLENFYVALDRLQQLEAFVDGEFGYDETLKMAQAPAPASEKQPLDSKEAVSDDYFVNVVGPLWKLWLGSLAQNFGLYVTEPQQRIAYDTFVAKGYSFHDRRSYDKVRLSMIARGIWPTSARTPDEALSVEIDTSTEDISSFEARRRIAARISALSRA
jgi:hypothetical protein